MTVLLCTSKILKSEYCTWKVCQLKFLGRTGWKGKRTMSTLNTAMMPLLIIYLHPSGVVGVGWEPSATKDSLMVL
jgi:hypothetical protein